MRRISAILALLLYSSLAFGALSATVQWDVRTTGSDNSGGGFDPAVAIPGTDYSQQTSPQVTYTDLTIGATTTQVTSAGFPFATCTSGVGYCGNLIHILSAVSGTCTVGWYEVLSTSTITATLDRSAGTTGAVCNAKLGGSLADPYGPFFSTTAGYQNGQTVWWKSGTYTLTVTPTTFVAIPKPLVLIGYGTTHGDNGTAPLLTTATNGVVLWPGFNFATYIFRNISFSNTAATRANGFTGTSATIYFSNCTFNGFATAINGVPTVTVNRSLIENSTTATASGQIQGASSLTVIDSVITGGAYDGILMSGPSFVNIQGSIISGNTQAGVSLTTLGGPAYLTGNTIYGNGSHGLLVTTFSLGGSTALFLQNNLFDDNTGDGVNVPVLPFTQPENSYNAYYNNAAARVNLPAGVGDVIPTAEPLTNPGSGDFSLNSTSGGGPTLKGMGYPGVMPNGSTTGHTSIGAIPPATSSSANFGDSH